MQIDSLKSGMAENGKCAGLVESYLAEASRMERSVEKSAASHIGWLGNELAINFARQRLINVEIIKNRCS